MKSVVSILLLLLTKQVFGSEFSNCLSQSCLINSSCLDKCLEEHGLFEAEVEKKVFEWLDSLENENNHLKTKLSNLEKLLESLEDIHHKETRNITSYLNHVKNQITELENSQVVLTTTEAIMEPAMTTEMTTEMTTVSPSLTKTIREFFLF